MSLKTILKAPMKRLQVSAKQQILELDGAINISDPLP